MLTTLKETIFIPSQAEVNAVLGQEIEFELWDWDPGFPGVQNDDFLGRCGDGINSLIELLKAN